MKTQTIKNHIEQEWSDLNVKNVSFAFWDLHLYWLETYVGWRDATKKYTKDINSKDTHHRTVNLLLEYVKKTGHGNAHFGLTSSDVEDNVRRSLLSYSINFLANCLREIAEEAVSKFQTEDYNHQGAFTHWQRAGTISLYHRVNAWWQPILSETLGVPIIHGKKLGGAVGDQSAMMKLQILTNQDLNLVELKEQASFPWRQFILSSPWNRFPIQSSDHFDELDALNWLAKVASHLCKICTDLRFLASHGQVSIIQKEGYVGSSSIKDKSNPYILEKICGKCRTMMQFPMSMMQVLSNNGLERTLDTSWQSFNTMKTATVLFGSILDDLEEVKIEYWSIERSITESRDIFACDEIVKGEITRIEKFMSENNI